MLTIDDRRTKDMDDAVEVIPASTGWIVRVSIADVARKVTPGSDLDKTARERGATQYFAAYNSPMLPRELAEWHLSLFPNKVRKSLNVEISLSPSLEVLSTRLVRGEVVSKAKLSYTEIPSILTQEDSPFHEEIFAARNVALGLLTRRQKAGALIFYDLNKGWVTTEDGSVLKMKKREDTIGYIIIQELMILTNVAVATYLIENKIPVLFRNHEPLGTVPERATLIQDIAALAEEGTVVDLESLQRASNGLFKRAAYGVENTGHYGLNEKAYVHFTSPIRRYADLVVHQQLRAHLKGEPLPHDTEGLSALATHLTELSNEQRDRTRKIYTERAETAAVRNIESRKLDGLPLKDFERAAKVELRSGASPSDAMVDAWTHRLANNDMPISCITEALMLLNGADGWDMLREASVGALQGRTADAVTIVNQAQALGWRAVAYDVSQTGPAHMPAFAARAQLSVDALEKVFEGAAVCPAGGSAKLVKQRAVVELLRNVVLSKDGPAEPVVVEGSTPPPPPAKVKPVPDMDKNPVSKLMELSQGRKLPAPKFDFLMAGPPHAPVVTCTATFAGQTAKAVAASKQEAKAAAAKALSEKVA